MGSIVFQILYNTYQNIEKINNKYFNSITLKKCIMKYIYFYS